MDTALTIWNCFVPVAIIYLIAELYCRNKFGFHWLQNLKTNYRKGGVLSKCMIVADFLSHTVL